jgi:hypothetical protein
MTMRAKLWLLFFLGLSGIAQASNPAIGLLNQCRVAVNPPGTGITPPALKCLSYIDGWLEGVGGTLSPDEKGFVQITTIEDGVTAPQAAKVFVLYMENHPEEENKPRQVALMHAMLNAGLVTLDSPGKDKGK